MGMVTARKWFLILMVVVMTGVCWAGEQKKKLKMVMDDGKVSISCEDRPILTYHYNNVPYKPYVGELYSPGGVNVLRDSPWDHLHHHGLMYAMRVDGVNFWEEVDQSGKQVHRGFEKMNVQPCDGKDIAGFTERIVWEDSGGAVLLNEDREIEVTLADDNKATVVDWTSRFSVPAGKGQLELTGTAYHGLGMRFPAWGDKRGKFINSTGKPGELLNEKWWMMEGDWCAYQVKGDGGKEVTVAMFDHPSNPRRPTVWFTMKKNFSYLSATLELYKRPLVLKEGEELVLRYGVMVWDGMIDADQIAKARDAWLKNISCENKKQGD